MKNWGFVNVANAVFEIMVPRQGEVMVRLCQLGNIFQKPPWLHLQNLHFSWKWNGSCFNSRKLLSVNLVLDFCRFKLSVNLRVYHNSIAIWSHCSRSTCCETWREDGFRQPDRQGETLCPPPFKSHILWRAHCPAAGNATFYRLTKLEFYPREVYRKLRAPE